MAKLEITASNLPNSGKGLSRLCAMTVTEESSSNRFFAASSIAGEKSMRDRRRLRMVELDQRKQASVTGSEVENAPHRGRNEFQKCRFTFGPMRYRIGAAQVIKSMFGGRPEIDAHIRGPVKSINSNSMARWTVENRPLPHTLLKLPSSTRPCGRGRSHDFCLGPNLRG